MLVNFVVVCVDVGGGFGLDGLQQHAPRTVPQHLVQLAALADRGHLWAHLTLIGNRFKLSHGVSFLSFPGSGQTLNSTARIRRPSLCPHPQLLVISPRRCGAQPARRPRERHRATPCRSASRTGSPELPSLSHGAPSGVAEPSLRLLGSRQSPRPFLRPALLSNRAPSLRRHYSASPVLRASPPPSPARPDPRGLSVGACHAAGRASRVASIPLFHACRRHYPGGAGRCMCRSLPGRWQPSLYLRRVGLHVTRFEACSAFTRVAARMVAEPPTRPFAVGVLRAI